MASASYACARHMYGVDNAALSAFGMHHGTTCMFLSTDSLAQALIITKLLLILLRNGLYPKFTIGLRMRDQNYLYCMQ
jgi:hypothetical protein